MKTFPLFDVAVIGGGLAGLSAAAYAAHAGRSVILFDKAPQAGGRATTHTADGFYFNQGPHALYKAGEGVGVLRELGVTYSGAPASPEGSWVILNGGKHPLPRTPETFISCSFLSEDSRQEAIALFGSLRGIQTEELAHVPLREWLDTTISDDALRAHVEALIRLSTYGNDPERQSTGAALEQLIIGGSGVDYLDGGWQTLVDGLCNVAREVGVRIETRASVSQLESDGESVVVRLTNGDSFTARSAISTVAPATVARMVNGGTLPSLQTWAGEAVPIYAACLDIALRRLPATEHQFAIGLDRPLYYSVHTRSARLAPEGGALIQLAKYLPTEATDTGRELESELEGLLEHLQPGWRDELVARRFLPRMLVANSVVTAKQGSLAGRPGPVVPEVPNLFVAGDWVGPHGMLADASLASARQAATLLEQWLATNSPGLPATEMPAAVA